MPKQPLLSIIVPVYKAENYLPDCLDSILCQTLTDFELILVNDGSPDNSGKICDAYASKDNRITVIHKANGGASTARNAGVEAACGKYIGWVDADDRISPEMYKILYHLAESYNADISECQHILYKGNQIIRSGMEEPIAYGKGDFILKQFFNAQMKPGLTTKIYKREIWNGVRFPVNRLHQDCYVNMRFALVPNIYVRISAPLYYYIVREKSITTTFTTHEIRQAVYLYDYTMTLSDTIAPTEMAKRYLKKDAINRLMCRYFEVSINISLKNQNIYNYYLRKKLGLSVINYLLMTDLPLKTRISYALLLLNLKNLQLFLQRYFGKKQ
jgi:glycosyltransferase involved in cell wall biosynthesis